MMNTVFISRKEALIRGELFDLTDETKAAGWPLDLAITHQARKVCLDGQDEGAMQKLLEGIEAVLVVAIILHTPPRRALRIDYRAWPELKNSSNEYQQVVSLTLRVNFTEEGMPSSATLGLKGEKLRC